MKWILVIVLCCWSNLSQAQATMLMDIDLFYKDRNQIKVRFTPPIFSQANAIYIFTPSDNLTDIPSSTLPIISFKLSYKNGQVNYLTTKRNGEFQIDKINEVETIEYIFDCDQLHSNIYKASNTILHKDKIAILHFINFIGYFKEYQDLRLQPKIRFTNFSNHLVTTDYIQANNNTLILEPKTYVELLGKIAMISNEKTTHFNLGVDSFHITYYSDNKSINESKFINTIKAITTIAIPYIQPLSKNNYHFVFYLSYKNQESEHGHGGMTNENSSFFYININQEEEIIYAELEHTLLHELLHQICPGKIKSYEAVTSYQINNSYSQHLWMYEGLIDYLTIKLLLHNHLISSENFFHQMRHKIMQMNRFPPISLSKLSERIFTIQNKQLHNLFYSKGALIAMCLDLFLINESNGNRDIWGFLNYLEAKYGTHRYFRDEDLWLDLEKYSAAWIAHETKKCVIKKNYLPIEQALYYIGYDYANTNSISVYKYGDFSIQLQNDKKSIIVKNVGINSLNLINDDRIIEINNQQLNEKNYSELSTKLILPKYNEEIKISLQRNAQTIKMEAKAIKSKHQIRYVIVANPYANAYQKKLQYKFLGQ